jgi:hypothetical protein
VSCKCIHLCSLIDHVWFSTNQHTCHVHGRLCRRQFRHWGASWGFEKAGRCCKGFAACCRQCTRVEDAGCRASTRQQIGHGGH